MNIKLIDNWRGAAFSPTSPVTDPFAALDELRRCTNDEHKQAVFEADKEFMDAIKAVDSKLERLNTTERTEGPTFKGIPIRVR